jgi:hypothetical protein
MIPIPALDPVQARPLWRPGPSGRSRPSPRTAQRLCDLAAMATASAFGLPAGELLARTRRSSYVAFARQSAMYLAHVAFGLSYDEIGRGFRRDRTTAARACRLVEDRRDDPAVDGILASLEQGCARLRMRLAAEVRT